MRICILFVLQLFFVNCSETTSVKNSTIDLKKDNLKLIEILSFNGLNSTSIKIIPDSVFFIIPEDNNSSKNYSARLFYYDSKYKTFHFKNFPASNSYSGISNQYLQSKKILLSIGAIGNPNLIYQNLPTELVNNSKIKKSFDLRMKSQTFNNKIFFMDKITPDSIYIYDLKTKAISSFDISQKFKEITNFFLFDIDNDGYPEIFIFNIGRIPRNEIISYSIFSIRKDSILTNYE